MNRPALRTPVLRNPVVSFQSDALTNAMAKRRPVENARLSSMPAQAGSVLNQVMSLVVSRFDPSLQPT
jgi:hypothetical protein